MSSRPRLLVHQELLVSGSPRKRLSHQASKLLLLSLLLAGLFWGMGSFNVAHALSTTPASSTTPLPYNANGNSENPPLVHYNAIQQYSGPLVVQHHPKVYLVFWGPEWNQDPDGVRPRVISTFRALGGSQYNNILSQYADETDYIHNDVQMAASVIDTNTPPSNLDIGFETPVGVWDNAQIRHEADKMIASNHWPVNQDSQVIVFPQKGATYNHGSGWCGVHSYNSTAAAQYAYGEIQYGDQWYGSSTAPCDPTGTVADDIAMTAVHEYAEMATDPRIYASPTVGGQWYVAYSAGWHTKDGSKSTPQEIADLCEGYDGSSYAW